MGTEVYYLCGMQGNRLMDMTDECNLKKGKGSMNEYLKNTKPHPQSTKEIAQTETFLKANGQHTGESLWAQITKPKLKLA